MLSKAILLTTFWTFPPGWGDSLNANRQKLNSSSVPLLPISFFWFMFPTIQATQTQNPQGLLWLFPLPHQMLSSIKSWPLISLIALHPCPFPQQTTLITSSLTYCNSLLTGLPVSNPFIRHVINRLTILNYHFRPRYSTYTNSLYTYNHKSIQKICMKRFRTVSFTLIKCWNQLSINRRLVYKMTHFIVKYCATVKKKI